MQQSKLPNTPSVAVRRYQNRILMRNLQQMNEYKSALKNGNAPVLLGSDLAASLEVEQKESEALASALKGLKGSQKSLSELLKHPEDLDRFAEKMGVFRDFQLNLPGRFKELSDERDRLKGRVSELEDNAASELVQLREERDRLKGRVTELENNTSSELVQLRNDDEALKAQLDGLKSRDHASRDAILEETRISLAAITSTMQKSDNLSDEKVVQQQLEAQLTETRQDCVKRLIRLCKIARLPINDTHKSGNVTTNSIFEVLEQGITKLMSKAQIFHQSISNIAENAQCPVPSTKGGFTTFSKHISDLLADGQTTQSLVLKIAQAAQYNTSPPNEEELYRQVTGLILKGLTFQQSLSKIAKAAQYTTSGMLSPQEDDHALCKHIAQLHIDITKLNEITEMLEGMVDHHAALQKAMSDCAVALGSCGRDSDDYERAL